VWRDDEITSDLAVSAKKKKWWWWKLIIASKRLYVMTKTAHQAEGKTKAQTTIRETQEEKKLPRFNRQPCNTSITSKAAEHPSAASIPPYHSSHSTANHSQHHQHHQQ
jgi:hypothetical protein